MTGPPYDYGPIDVGVFVILGRHREVEGDDNWNDLMDAYVGQVAQVVELPGVDSQGCPGVRVDMDGGDWFWRIRDMELATTPPTPQDCGMTYETVYFGPVYTGTIVILGRHREVNGDDNWSSAMDEYVGLQAQVIELAGVDPQGCPVAHVDVDDGIALWRIRDFSFP